jgi:glycosyltransferase involved in cell wall biosynthesis
MSVKDLRVALLAGTLGTGGAEKQLVYVARGLLAEGVTVRVYCLTRGEAHEASLAAIGLAPEWVGRWPNPLLRVAAFSRRLRRFRPHILHSAHFYTNLYVGLAGYLTGAMSVGTVRSDGLRELGFHPIWGRSLLSLPDGLIVNSTAALRNVVGLRKRADQVCLLPNVLDLAEFDRRAGEPAADRAEPSVPSAIIVGRLIKAKRIDRFLRVLALACQSEPTLRGVVVGDGPERENLESLANELGLSPGRVRFLGERSDVPALLSVATLLMLTSDQEGFPNVLLEAMAARLPVVTTPAGDAARVVRDGVTGDVVPFEDLAGLADRLLELVRSPSRRTQFGQAGRLVVESEYGSDRCGLRALGAYAGLARAVGRREVEDVLLASP